MVKVVRTSGGFSLLEVVISSSLLACGGLILAASMAQSASTSSLARERETAKQAIRAWLEAMRAKYPEKGSFDLTGFLADGSTPADPAYLASGSGAARLLDAKAIVCKAVDETGLNWGPIARSPSVAPLASAIAAVDRKALGFPRDLDGTGFANTTIVEGRRALVVPVKVELSWVSGSGTRGANARQRMTLHAILGPQH